MSCSISFHSPRALPNLCQSQCKISSLSINTKQIQPHNSKPIKAQLQTTITRELVNKFSPKISCLAIQITALLGTVADPAYAVTGVNNEEDLVSVLIQLGICAFLYFLVAPPFIMNWLRIRWYKRNVFEMYLQFMFVFLFFPGVMLWAPFLNFRKFPRDPSMKYPWSVPKDPSKIRNDYRKYPWATPEDYE